MNELYCSIVGVGILVSGTVTADASALAQAVQRTDRSALLEFVRAHPESKFAPDALLLAAIDNVGRLHSSDTSDKNASLSCELWIERIDDGSAKVRWVIKGAKSASIYPLGISGEMPTSGEKTVALDDILRVLLTAHDKVGNEVSCWVSLGSTPPVVSDQKGSVVASV